MGWAKIIKYDLIYDGNFDNLFHKYLNLLLLPQHKIRFSEKIIQDFYSFHFINNIVGLARGIRPIY